MRLLILGGTRFVGRALIDDGLARGWEVTALNRGLSGTLPAGASLLRADRTSSEDLERALGDATWDLVVDTWAGSPRVVTAAARSLAARVDHYGYVSSISVYTWGSHVDESSPVIAVDPTSEEGAYAELKRAAEIGVLQEFPSALLARGGLILGPYEDIGRLPWWLDRISRGGRVVAPGRPDRPLQYVDARDLATWLLSALSTGVTGPVDAISRSGHASTSDLLEACRTATGSDAELVWVEDAVLSAAGAAPWTHLPCWVPETGDFSGYLEADVSRAAATGLVCRPVEETVADTWAWLQQCGMPVQRPDRPVHGLPADLEQLLLDAA